MKYLSSFILLIAGVAFMSFSFIDFEWIDKDANTVMISVMSDDAQVNGVAKNTVAEFTAKMQKDNIASYEVVAGTERYNEVVSKLNLETVPAVVFMTKDKDPVVLAGAAINMSTLMDAYAGSAGTAKAKCCADGKGKCCTDKAKKSCSSSKKGKACCSKKKGA